MVPLWSFAQDGGQPGAFLRMGVGSRAIGMGNAFTAVANDVSSMYWNAAGLGRLELREVMLTYSFLSMSRYHNFAAFAWPLKTYGALGISWINLGIGGIEGRDMFGRVTETYANNEHAFLLSWGLPLTGSLYVGATGKYLLHTLADNKSTGFGFDIGALYELTRTFRIGLSIRDVSTGVAWDTDSGIKEGYPAVIRLGVAYSWPDFPVIVAVDYEKISNLDATFHLGVEGELYPGLGLRMGLDDGKIAAGAFVGMPTKKANLRMDYSFSQDRIDRTYVHRFTMSVQLARYDHYFRVKRDLRSRDYRDRSDLKYQPPIARVIRTLEQYPNVALINIGYEDNVFEGQVFELYRNDTVTNQSIVIGVVEVIRVEDKVSAIRVVDLHEGYMVELGDFLRVNGE